MLNRTSSLARRPSLTSSHLRTRSFSESRPRPTILMPAMSPFLSEAKVTRWMKKEGESFVAGESLVQIESDFVTADIVAESPGIIGQILIPDGTNNVPVAKVIATVARNAEELSQMKQQTRSSFRASPPRPILASPSALRAQYVGPATPRATSGSSSPRRSEQPLLSAMDHRPASEIQQQLHVSRGMATGPAPSGSPSFPQAVTEGAMLRRKIVANMAQSSGFGLKNSQGNGRSTTNDYFEGII